MTEFNWITALLAFLFYVGIMAVLIQIRRQRYLAGRIVDLIGTGFALTFGILAIRTIIIGSEIVDRDMLLAAMTWTVILRCLALGAAVFFFFGFLSLYRQLKRLYRD